jgi:phenylalanyl-tRNA synthetase beta chain
MKFSYNWLKELFGLKKSSESRIEKAKESIKGVVIGKILEIKNHPNADKLQLTLVDIGKQKLNIVCGAWNIKVGDMVPVATVGTRLPNGFEIKEIEIRGERSQGMLCAEDELGLGTDHTGIMILSSKLEIGSDFRVESGDAQFLK